MIDSLEADLDHIKAVINPRICLEVGPGSGVVISSLALLLGNDSLYYSYDVNRDACEATLKTASENSVQIESIRASFESGLEGL